MEEYTFFEWLAVFYIYCFAGWIWESCYVSTKNKHWINRGFLHGPILPIYGSGAVVILASTYAVKDSMVLVFIFGMVSSTVLEFFTGCAMEKLFGVRYWDYSDKKFNVKGHICLSSTIAWGFFSLLLVYILNNPVDDLIRSTYKTIIQSMVFIISVMTAIDFTQSYNEAMDLKEMLEKISESNEKIRILSRKIEIVSAFAEDDYRKLKQQIAERKEEMKKISLRADRQYNRLAKIIKRNPGAVSYKHQKEMEDIKDLIKRV